MTTRSPAVDSLKIEQRAQRQDALHTDPDNALSEALEGTFPASDPVSAQAAVTAGSSPTDQFLDGYDDAPVSGRASDFRDFLVDKVRTRPLSAMGWAVAAGLVLGFWAAR